MTTRVPRLLLAAPASGGGKTTVATGLMAAWRAAGLEVAGFKVGPDYIDPGYHAMATGRPGRNLDAVLCGPDLMAPLLVHGATTPAPADVSVVEGVMGLFDGQLGTGVGSSAHLARLTDTPVVLVVDCSGASLTHAAVIEGLAAHDPRVDVAGVILNRVGSPRQSAEVRRGLAGRIPVLGEIPRDASVSVPSRHLGLVPAAERRQAAEQVAALGRLVGEHVDLEALLEVAGRAPDLDAPGWDPREAMSEGRPAAAASRQAAGVEESEPPLVAVAGGAAFTFSYPETVEMVEAAGCRVVTVDPLVDTHLPEGVCGLHLGGGFPEVHASRLAANAALLADVAARVAAGMPVVAECAGLLYLCRRLDGHAMTGVLPLDAAMSSRLTMGYRRAHGPLGHVNGHEFHRTVVTAARELAVDTGTPGPAAGMEPGSGAEGEPGKTVEQGQTVEQGPVRYLRPAWTWTRPDGTSHDDGVLADPAGAGEPTVLAAYLHLHWAGAPQVARWFVDRVWQYRGQGEPGGVPGASASSQPILPSELASSPEPGSPGHASLRGGGEVDLHHHGDQDLAEGLVDLAVNVRVERTPDWLVQAVTGSAGRWASYPDAEPARQALAAAHGVDPAAVLVTNGAAEAFTLVARALSVRHPLVVHPQFTEPEAALEAAGHRVDRLVLGPADGFALNPAAVPRAADLVVVGNPTNPTGRLHRRSSLAALRRPGRVLVVDEAFMDATDGAESLVGPDMDGVLVLRSLTKTFGLAGIRAGYVVGDPALVAALARHQPPWSVSAPAVAAVQACCSQPGQAHRRRLADELPGARADLVARLEGLGLSVVPSGAPFVLVDTSAWGPTSLRPGLAERGFAVRRGETFPGLGPGWIRLAVRDPHTHARLAAALTDLKESL